MRHGFFARFSLALGLTFCVAMAAIAAAVYGAIGDKYNALGRENGPLGAAVTDEASAPHGGRFNAFKNGFIYWHPDVGAFAVWGAIGVKWSQLGRVDFGYPVTDESKTPDQRGRYNHFRAVQLPGKPESSIYWTPQWGAVAVYGAIRDKWASEGWERGRVGYPIADEAADGAFRRTTFERGFIRWSAGAGAEVIPTGLAAHDDGGVSGKVVNGLVAYADPPAGGRLELYRDSTLFSPSELCARFLNQPGLNDTFRNALLSRIRPKLPGGFGIHSQSNHSTGMSCEARTELGPHSISIQIRVPHNRLFVRVTTPDGLPGSLDPNFAVTYDLVVHTSITFPDTVAGTLVQGPVTVQGMNVSPPQTHSITGNLVIAANDIVGFLGGPDFFAAMRKGGVTQMSGVNAGTAQLNQKLAQLRSSAPAGTRINLVPEADFAAVVVTNR